ncbi:MAG: G8 domain-containing protein, partial [Pseudobdellovibrionaceae bacterium]|nr:G8 domain-containing protein [Pseudobdellovibrionaceae bacterium]
MNRIMPKYFLHLLLAISCSKEHLPKGAHLADNISPESEGLVSPSDFSVPDEENLAKIPVPEDINVEASQVACPHLEGRAQMIGIDEARSRWLKDDVLTIPSDTDVLVHSTPVNSEGGVTKITIPKIVVGEKSRLIFDDSPIHMKVKDIVVHGSLLIGSQSCRISSDITLEFYNDEKENIQEIYGRSGKGIVVMGSGSIDIHGKLYHHTWSRLQQTAVAGVAEVALQNDVNWEPGQKVVVVTSSMRDYPYEDQNEVMTIAAVKDKRIVQFTDKLKFNHFGGKEYQVEVGLLSRKIKLIATPGPNSMFGGHVMIMGQGRVSGAELYKMGQQNFLGRYPLHFHMAGDLKKKNSYLTDNSIWQSNWRCISVHGSDNGVVSRNVAFDVFGHCYYLEDGTEVGNEFSYNLAARIKIMGSTEEKSLKEINTPAQKGFTLQETDGGFSNPADRAAAGFYISNANNRFIGNAASGG